MRKQKQLDLTKHKIWKDRNIKPEAKEIYAYLFTEGFDKTISHISIGKIQSDVKSIKNVGFKKCLKILEENKYLLFKEYDRGLYEYHIN